MTCSMQVASFYSALGRMGSTLPDKTGIAVCTIEKANSLVTRMIEDGTLSGTFSAVIVDELHMVDDEDRGYLLELLLTKLLHVGRLQKEQQVGVVHTEGVLHAEVRSQTWGLVTQALGSAESGASQMGHVQLIGMSATLPNIRLVARWLDAAVYETKFRPVCFLDIRYAVFFLLLEVVCVATAYLSPHHIYIYYRAWPRIDWLHAIEC